MTPHEPDPERLVSSQDVVFERGVCRVEVVEVPWPLGGHRFLARMTIIEDDGRLRPLIEHGEPVEVHAESEPLALSSALAFLEHALGTLSLYPAHGPAVPDPEHAGNRSIDLAQPPGTGR